MDDLYVEKEVEREELATNVDNAVSIAKRLVVESDADMEVGVGLIKDLKAVKDDVEDKLGPVCKATHASWKAATSLRKKHLDPLEDAERAVRNAMGAYSLKVELAARVAKEKAEKEEQERKKTLYLEAEARTKALTESAGSLTMQIVTLGEEVNKAEGIEREVLETKLNELCTERDSALKEASEVAERTAEIAHTAPALSIVKTPAKVAGMNTRFKDTAEVEDLMLLVKEIAKKDSTIPIACIQADMKVIQKLSDASVVLPGIKIVPKPIVTVR